MPEKGVLNQNRVFYTNICAKQKLHLKKRNNVHLGNVTNPDFKIQNFRIKIHFV